MADLKFIITANCFDEDDILVLKENITISFPNISSELNETYFKYENCELEIHYEAHIKDNVLSEEDINDIIRLTHHAECLYVDTDLQHFSIKVYVDGKWY